MYSSWSMAIEMAWRSLVARSPGRPPPVEHVEPHVEGRGLDRGQETDALAPHFVGEGDVAADIDPHRLVETVGEIPEAS